MFVQRTEEPRLTVRVPGVNAKSTMLASRTGPGAGPGVAVGAAVGRGVLVGAGLGADVGRGVEVALGALVGAGVGFRVGTGVTGGWVGPDDWAGEAEGVAPGSPAVPPGAADAPPGVGDAGAGDSVAPDAAATGEPAAGAPVDADGAGVEPLGEQPAMAIATAIAAMTPTSGCRAAVRDLSMRCPTSREADWILLVEDLPGGRDARRTC